MGSANTTDRANKSSSPSSPTLQTDPKSPGRNSNKKRSVKVIREKQALSYNPEMRLFDPDELEEEVHDIGCTRLIYTPVKQVVGLKIVMYLSSASSKLLLKELKVSQIEVDFSCYFPIYDTVFLFFRLEYLNFLTLKFSDPLNAHQFRSALECISKLSLKNLKLIFFNSKALSFHSFKALSDLNETFEHIRGFSIEFYDCPNLNDDCLMALQQMILTMPELSIFEFSAIRCLKLTENGLINFSDCITHFHKLEEFKFCCSQIRGIGNNFAVTLKEKFSHLKQLTHFNFSLHGTYKGMTDKGYKPIIETITKFNQLRSLTLDLSYSTIEKSSLDIQKLLETLSPLDKLCLDLKRCPKITSEGLGEIFKGLLKQNKLFEFELSLRGCDVFDAECAKKLELSLKDMGSLIKLSLDFSYCPEFGDRGLKYITEGMKNLNFIEYLNFQIINCNKISDLGFYYLCFAFESSTKIKKLILLFEGLKLLTNISLEYLSQGLSCLNNLDSLTLNFFENENLNEGGINSITTALAKLDTIKNMSLTAGLSTKSSAISLINLALCLDSIKDLEIIFITRTSKDYSLDDADLGHFVKKAQKLISLKRLYFSFDRFVAGQIGARSVQDSLDHITECTVDCNMLREPSVNSIILA